MPMHRSFARFVTDETGATTVDWVVLTGGAVMLAVIMVSTMNGSTTSVATEIEGVISDVAVQELGDVSQILADAGDES